jgi:peptide/nickel transport system ATP-binding protein
MAQTSLQPAAVQTSTKPLLKVSNLEVEYRTKRGIVRAVDNVSFDIYPNEVFGLAGESGCGKSTIAHAIMRLLKPPAYIAGGSITFGDTHVLELGDENLNGFRWKEISIVFQSAMNSLNPVLSVGSQITDVILAHMLVSKREALERAVELLNLVGIDPDRINSYPHQLSGGMRQRSSSPLRLRSIRRWWFWMNRRRRWTCCRSDYG